MSFPAGTYLGLHCYWTGPVRLDADGAFSTAEGIVGHWLYSVGRLTLAWKKWPAESAQWDGERFAGDIILVPVRSVPFPYDLAPYKANWDDMVVAVDFRHAAMLYDFLVAMNFRRILEIGCCHGGSTTAIIEAQKVHPEMEVHLCDTEIRPQIHQIADGRPNIHLREEFSVETLHNAARFDFVFVDGDHRLHTVYRESQLLLDAGVRCIAAHDTSYEAIGGHAVADDFMGSSHIKNLLQASYYCIEDNTFRQGEMTHRGMLFAARDPSDFGVIRQVYGKWCLGSPEITRAEAK